MSKHYAKPVSRLEVDFLIDRLECIAPESSKMYKTKFKDTDIHPSQILRLISEKLIRSIKDETFNLR